MEDFTRLQAAIEAIKVKVDALKAAPPVNHQALIDELAAAAEAIAANVPTPA